MTYKGLWEHNQKSGFRILNFSNGDIQKENFRHSKIHGCGIYVDSEGKYFYGKWQTAKDKEFLFAHSQMEVNQNQSGIMAKK